MHRTHRMTHRAPILVALGAVVCLAGFTAQAATHGVAPAGGGIPALEVSVDLAAATVDANGARIPIPLDRVQLPGENDVVVEAVAVGRGKHVVHIRIPIKDDPTGAAWEAILAAGKAQPVFSGMTGRTAGDPGERTGKAVRIIDNGATSFVLVGDIREDLSICGQSATLLDPLAVYPATLDLRPATVQRLDANTQASATRVVATDGGPRPTPPLARLLVARGSSVPGSRGAELTDGDATTSWVEKRPGVGQGEFVVMAAPRDVPISRMQLIVAPPGRPPANGAAPRTFFLVTTTQTFEVTLPEDAWLKPAESYEVAFPLPIDASCIALVLDGAQTRDLLHPDVGLAELVAYSEFDTPGATLDDVARALSTRRGIAAAQVLERAGDGALAAVEHVYAELDEGGRALAIDVAASHERCEEAAPLLVRALCEKGGQAPRKAREKLERCNGAAPALARSLRENAQTRACVAPTLATIAPREALEPIADAMDATPEDERETRATLREAFAAALNAAPPGMLATLLGDARRSATGRLEIMRAAEGRVAEAPAESEAVVTELSKGSAPMRTRYLVLEPLEELARAGNRSAAARVAGAITHDEAWPVRARAAEIGAGVPEAEAALLAAARDPEPRVREAALQALAPSPPAGAVDIAASCLAQDGWSFVRAQAVAVLAKAPASRAVDEALGGALRDGATSVRGAALVALARHQATGYREAVRARLDDPDEDADVRAAAAQALGALCDVKATDRLTELARTLGRPATGDEQQQIGLGALVGLAALHPRDLQDRVAPLLAPAAPAYARAAARQALSARPTCQ
jgi:HEAT repeat protein